VLFVTERPGGLLETEDRAPLEEDLGFHLTCTAESVGIVHTFS
jgi:hypothetical protein